MPGKHEVGGFDIFFLSRRAIVPASWECQILKLSILEMEVQDTLRSIPLVEALALLPEVSADALDFYVIG